MAYAIRKYIQHILSQLSRWFAPSGTFRGRKISPSLKNLERGKNIFGVKIKGRQKFWEGLAKNLGSGYQGGGKFKIAPVGRYPSYATACGNVKRCNTIQYTLYCVYYSISHYFNSLPYNGILTRIYIPNSIP